MSSPWMSKLVIFNQCREFICYICLEILASGDKANNLLKVVEDFEFELGRNSKLFQYSNDWKHNLQVCTNDPLHRWKSSSNCGWLVVSKSFPKVETIENSIPPSEKGKIRRRVYISQFRARKTRSFERSSLRNLLQASRRNISHRTTAFRRQNVPKKRVNYRWRRLETRV